MSEINKELLKELLFVATLIMIVLFAMGYMISKAENYENKSPCEAFANRPISRIPARCIEFYKSLK